MRSDSYVTQRELTASRLRTLPFLPVEQRPTEIVSDTGKTIKVDKKVVENHEKVMKKGNVRHSSDDSYITDIATGSAQETGT